MVKLTRALILPALIVLLCAPAYCQVYYSRDFEILAADGTFLGNCSRNEYDSDSIFNEYGTHGSRYGSESIWNSYGTYGSEYSSYSPFNKYAASPPYIIYNGSVVGRLTVNRYIQDAINPWTFIGWLKANAI